MELIAYFIAFLTLQLSNLSNMGEYSLPAGSELVLSTVAFVEWGNGAGQLPLRTEVAFPMGLSTEQAPSLVASPVWLRLDDAGGLHLLEPSSGKCVRYDQKGDFLGSVEFGTGILDLHVVRNGYVLLVDGEPQGLRYVSLDGGSVWRRSLSMDGGRATALFPVGYEIGVIHEGNKPGITYHNQLDGSVLRQLDLPTAAAEWWRVNADHIGTMVYDPVSRRRGLGTFSLRDGMWHEEWMPSELYGALATVFAGDGSGGLHLRMTSDLGGGYQWGRIDGKGAWLSKAPLWQVVTGNDGKVAWANWIGNAVEIRTNSGTEVVRVQLETPEHCSWQFTGVTADGGYQLDLRNAYTGWKRRVLVDGGGIVREGAAPSGEVICRMQSPRTWVGLGDGFLMLVSNGDGVCVVRAGSRE